MNPLNKIFKGKTRKPEKNILPRFLLSIKLNQTQPIIKTEQNWNTSYEIH